MIYPRKREFLKISKYFNLIPVYKEIGADIETPVSVFLKTCSGPYSFLFESAKFNERWGRYSFISNDPLSVFLGRRREIFSEYGRDFSFKGDYIDGIRRIIKSFKVYWQNDFPSATGGCFGYVAYDIIKDWEPVGNKNILSSTIPLIYFIIPRTIIVFDHLLNKMKIVSWVRNDEKDYEDGIRRIDEIEKSLVRGIYEKEEKIDTKITGTNFKKDVFEKIVRRAKNYIINGDVVQVVLSRRIEGEIERNPFNIYRSLRYINPSPYMFYMKFKDLYLIGSSPEILVRKERDNAIVRPIAGTRRRGKNEDEDRKFERELLNDEKEIAEHIMLVDLGRNDIGKVCIPGTVEVYDKMVIERYSHVMHIVSGVRGKLKRGEDSFSLFKATFPAGTVTGAPKVRAMQIIEELENTARGIYSGSVGYFSFNGDMDMAITIRTIYMKGKRFYVQAGAGIVYDSVPEREFYETENKAKALVKAINDKV